ncbi:hypothetical protein KC845_02335, partial [Candidatus Kaiserbacteria bacterium]|nr:hypothetical protein [Candidatus Kaiserbacteria bacterium]
QESLETRDEEIDKKYELWALENDIATSPGSVTVFRNEAGLYNIVRTDLESKGALIESLDYN